MAVQTHMTLLTKKHKDEGWEDGDWNNWSSKKHINYHNLAHLCNVFQVI